MKEESRKEKGGVTERAKEPRPCNGVALSLKKRDVPQEILFVFKCLSVFVLMGTCSVVHFSDSGSDSPSRIDVC